MFHAADPDPGRLRAGDVPRSGGLTALKYATFGNGINVTLGLPVIRTSVDHGTALAIAGKGTADPGSLFAAVNEAIRMVSRSTAT